MDFDYKRNLIKLAEACSDLVYGGEHGWERVDFDEFVIHVRQALGRGNRCLQGAQDKSKSLEKKDG